MVKSHSNVIALAYDLSKKINEGKQLSPEEKAWMDKPTSMDEVMKKIRGEQVGPKPTTEIAKSLRK
mgnify:CR=1 FL=1